MKRFIVVTTTFEGLHYWPTAPDSEKYLRDLHRHLFQVNLKVEVFHEDREIEINAFKRWVDGLLWGWYPSDTVTVPNLGFTSCETIAEKISSAVQEQYGVERIVECDVLEDGILGAGVVREPSFSAFTLPPQFHLQEKEPQILV